MVERRRRRRWYLFSRRWRYSLEVDPPRVLAHTWIPSFAGNIETVVRWELEPTDVHGSHPSGPKKAGTGTLLKSGKPDLQVFRRRPRDTRKDGSEFSVGCRRLWRKVRRSERVRRLGLFRTPKCFAEYASSVGRVRS